MLYGREWMGTNLPVDPALSTLLLLVLIVAMTHFLGSFAAYGSSLLAMPFFMAVTGDLNFSVGVLLSLGCVQSTVILIRNIRFVDRRKLLTICGGMLLGAPVGILLVNRLPRREILIILGVVLLGSGILGLFRKSVDHARWPPWANLLVIMGAGAIHGAFASGGSLLILYARNALTRKEAFRATLAMTWVVINALLLLRMALGGHLGSEILLPAVSCSAAVIAVGLAVEVLVRKFTQRAFMLLISILLILSGAVTLVRSV